MHAPRMAPRMAPRVPESSFFSTLSPFFLTCSLAPSRFPPAALMRQASRAAIEAEQRELVRLAGAVQAKSEEALRARDEVRYPFRRKPMGEGSFFFF